MIELEIPGRLVSKIDPRVVVVEDVSFRILER